MEDWAGTRLGRYEILRLVGRGGMATVYLAHDPALDRQVAVKVLHAHLAHDEAFVGRFRREARAVAALRHPNIVQVFDFGVEQNQYYMVMEYLEGGTLHTLLREASKEGACLPPREVLRLVRPLCSAIDYAAGQGMVHRDIKPSNIILTKAGEPILTDYGIAKMVGVTSLTVTGMVVGSAHYMAPEQAQGQETDLRTDIYALGVVIFQMLTGRVPYDADTSASVLAQHIIAPIPSLASINPALPAAFEEVITKALAKEPAARYQSAAELATGLEAALSRPAAEPTVVAAPSAGAPQAVRSEPRAEPGRGAAARPETPETAAPGAGPPGVPGAGLAAASGAGSVGASSKGPVAASRPSPAVAPPPAAPPPAAPPPAAESLAPLLPDFVWETPARQTFLQRLRKHPALLGTAGGVIVLAAILAGVLTRESEPTATTTTAPLAASVSSLISVISTAPFMTTTDSAPATTEALPGVSSQAAILRAEADNLRLAGKFKEAVAKYQQALQIQPNDAAARTGLGIAYYRLPKSPALGAQQLELAVTLEPANVLAWAYLGACRYQTISDRDGRDFTEAEKACNKALELDPNSALAHAFLGLIYSETRRLDAAQAEASRAVTLAPNDPEVLVAMGNVRANADDWQGAIPYYRRALTFTPAYPDYVLSLATAYRETGQFDLALEYCRNALDLDQVYEANAYRGIGRTLWDEGDYQGARVNLEKALELDDTDAFSHWALGGVFYDQGDYEAALPELERAVALRPENAGMLAWLGACYMALERWEEARTVLEKAVELAPDREDARELLDELAAKGH